MRWITDAQRMKNLQNQLLMVAVSHGAQFKQFLSIFSTTLAKNHQKLNFGELQKTAVLFRYTVPVQFHKLVWVNSILQCSDWEML